MPEAVDVRSRAWGVVKRGASSGRPDRGFSGPSGLFSVVLRPGPVDAFIDRLRLFGLGFSWGGFESLAVTCDPQLRARKHRRDYGGPVVRLHVGLEDPDDLIADLAQALQALA